MKVKDWLAAGGRRWAKRIRRLLKKHEVKPAFMAAWLDVPSKVFRRWINAEKHPPSGLYSHVCEALSLRALGRHGNSLLRELSRHLGCGQPSTSQQVGGTRSHRRAGTRTISRSFETRVAQTTGGDPRRQAAFRGRDCGLPDQLSGPAARAVPGRGGDARDAREGGHKRAAWTIPGGDSWQS